MDTQALLKEMEAPKVLESGEKAVMKIHDSVKIYKPEVKERIVKESGQVGTNRPYQAPIYKSYSECIQGLYRQGLLGFYKGNGYRQFFNLTSSLCQVEMYYMIKKNTGHDGAMGVLVSTIAAEILFHPFHLMES
jgi:hypothetical protein